MISGVLPRRATGMEILFLLFSETVLFRARGIAPRNTRRAYIQLNSSQKEIARFAERSIDECYPRYPSLARMRHVSSSYYNCCPPRDFCVVEKRTLLLRLSERPGRPRFVNNSLIKQISHFFLCLSELAFKSPP